MTPSNTILTTRIAMAVASSELLNARMLGYGWDDAYGSSWRALEEVRDIAERPIRNVLTRFRS